jgi:uncharacterized protein (TIGR03437 family)
MKRAAFTAALFLLATLASAQPSPDRIANSIETNRLRAVPGFVHRLAQPQYDRGVASSALALDHIQIYIKPTAAQQAALDALILDQQNPNSPNYRKWLTPAQYADRFGLSPRDHAKVIAWLKSEGLNVQESSSGRNWVSFAGSASQVAKAFRTSIHTYSVNGETHFANATDPQVPEAIADMVAGFAGLNDFHPKPNAVLGPKPDFNSGTNHYLSPGDFSAIYDLKPLYAAGIDGTGQTLAVVGQSDISVSDITGFRSDFGLSVNNPKLLLYGTDPGFNGAQIEANLDLEWSGAIAQKATVYYVYGQDAFTAWSYAVSLNVAPVVSISYGSCESDIAVSVWQSVAQQANALGITTVVASGDAGGAGCDFQGDQSVATHGKSVQFPADVPEVTAVGGTMFSEGSGSYWSTVNSLSGTALSYIPEVVWNETAVGLGLGAGGGGASRLFAKPAWQNGPGVPNDGARDVPDVSFSAAANHDGYLITYGGASSLYVVGGTSAGAPSMAGIVTLVNQYVVKLGLQKTGGLGNVNPQLYRLAQSAPTAFHDVTGGSNIVPCEQGTADCSTGSIGYNAGPGYDQASGLGSLDVNVLVNSLGTAVSPSVLSLTSSASKVTINDSVTVTAAVSSVLGAGTPTGTVNFLAFGTPLASATLSGAGGVAMASATFPAWMLGIGNNPVYAAYAGDAAFSGSGSSLKMQVTLPTTANTAAITAGVPGPVYAIKSGTEAPTWQASITLAEAAGVPALLTGFTIDGVAQTLSSTFPSVNIPAGGKLLASLVLRNQAVPIVHVFGFTGTDAGGNQWSRQVSVPFVGPVKEQQVNFNLWANPLSMQQNTAAPANCQWSQQITLDETTGYAQRIVALARGSVDISSTIPAVFGTTRLAPWGSLSGTVCWANVALPATDLLFVETEDDFGDLIIQEANVTFSGPAAAPIPLSASPAAVTLKAPTAPGFPITGTLSINVASGVPWTATVYPATSATSWLQLSQYSGTGAALTNLTASGAGFGPGVYRATILIQSPQATPEWTSIPVMFINGPAGPVITSANNAISGAPGAAPGMLLAVYGTQLAGVTQAATTLPLSPSMGGVSATVNGWPAPLLYVSPTQINLQVPYEAGTGLATVGINNNGQLAGVLVPVAQSSPAILGTTVAAKAGTYTTIYVSGVGDVNQSIPDGVPVATGTPVTSLPLPLAPIGVTVGGVPALIQFEGMTPGTIGLIQVNFQVPSGVAAGMQPVVITAGGVQSPPVMITVM